MGGGYGNGGKLAKVLEQYGVSINGYVVNKPYSGAQWLEDVLENAVEPVVLIVAYEGFKRKHMWQILEQYDEKVYDVLIYDFVAIINDGGLGYNGILEEKSEYEKLYRSLCDGKSKDVLAGFINQRISGDFCYLDSLCDFNQYFDEDIIKFGEHEIFVDCGAFIGDTAEEFCKQIKKQNASYDEIISFEPDEENFKQCQARGLEKHSCVQKGAYSRDEVLHFRNNNAGSTFVDDGENSVAVTAIDEIVGEKKVTMIKMDIEGSELEALHGARNTICKNRPRLAICVYHKREDLPAISGYIKSLIPDYKLYLRTYVPLFEQGELATILETVLYAI